MANSGRQIPPPLLFAMFSAFFVLVAVGYVARTRASATRALAAPVVLHPAAEHVAVLGRRPGLLFASAAFDRSNRRVMLAPPSSPDADRYMAPLECERVHFAGSAGICLSADRGLVTRYSARVFGPDFQVRHTLPLAGAPSRARVSPDGRRAATTVFVAGDSYNAAGFSTRTTLIDVGAGAVIADLEEFAVSRAGAPFQSADFNFWGVTFARDGNRFFATLRTGGTLYLVEGDVDRRSMRVAREGIECPSLSPDETRIVFKKRVSGSAWRLHLLDLATMRETPLAERRNVDDQVEWLDGGRIAYSLPSEAQATGGSDVWTVRVDGEGAPQMIAPRGYSPALLP